MLINFSFYKLVVSEQIMITLSQIIGLTSLAIEFRDGEYESIALNDHMDSEPHGGVHEYFGSRMNHLSRFANLKRLTILEICGDLQQWKKHLLDALLNNPDLEHLSLSISHETMDMTDVVEQSLPNDQRTYYRLFADLCLQYGERADAQLKLRSLRLSSGIYFPEVQCLMRMIDTTYLCDIFICNW